MYSNNTLHNAHKTNKNAHEKEHTFSRKSKNQKQNGLKRIWVNSPLVSKHFNFATKNYAIKKSSALKTINILFN